MRTLSLMVVFGAASELSFDGWYYYAGSAFAFSLAGLVCGYFIWRKGSMQTCDVEGEVRRTQGELARLRADLELERAELEAPRPKGS